MSELQILNSKVQQIGADSDLYEILIEHDFFTICPFSCSDKQIVLSLSCSLPICILFIVLNRLSQDMLSTYVILPRLIVVFNNNNLIS